MAANELEVVLKWENDVTFEMTAKREGGDVKTVVLADENGHIKDLWPSLNSICQTYFLKELKNIGDVMKV